MKKQIFKKLFVLILGICLVQITHAQVTIGSALAPTKGALLDLKAQQANADNETIGEGDGGFVLPRVSLQGISTLKPLLTDAEATAEVKKQLTGLMVYNLHNDGLPKPALYPGVYIWDGEFWQALNGKGQPALGPWNKVGTTEPSALNTDDSYIRGSIGIGTATPGASAILELDSPGKNKGFLPPRVNLKNSTDVVTIPNPAIGLCVYSLGDEATFAVPGFYFWNGAKWKQMSEEAESISPSISGLGCAGAQFYPTNYETGVPYVGGTLVIPYLDGNGGRYESTDAIIGGPVKGFVYTLRPGTLNYGAGNFIFSVSGTPTVTTPELIDFPINVLGQTCVATVGGTTEVKFMEYAKNSVSPIDAETPTKSITQLGNIMVRYNADGANWTGPTVEIKSLVPNQVSYVFKKNGQGGYGLEAYGRYISLGRDTDWRKFTNLNGTSGNASSDLNAKFQDIGQATVVFHNTKEIYRITLNANIDLPATGGVPAAPSAVTIFIEKLD